MENEMMCLECDEVFELETDLWLCDKCIGKFDLKELWKLHDNNEIDALNFNESMVLREKFRNEVS